MPWVLAAVSSWLLLEAGYLCWHYVVERPRLMRRTPHPDLGRTFRETVFARMCSQNLSEILRGWFLGTPASQLRRENVRDFVAFAIVSRNWEELDDDLRQECEDYLRRMEHELGSKFPDGRNHRAVCLRHSIEPLHYWPTPLALVGPTWLLRAALTWLAARLGGLSRRSHAQAEYWVFHPVADASCGRARSPRTPPGVARTDAAGAAQAQVACLPCADVEGDAPPSVNATSPCPGSTEAAGGGCADFVRTAVLRRLGRAAFAAGVRSPPATPAPHTPSSFPMYLRPLPTSPRPARAVGPSRKPAAASAQPRLRPQPASAVGSAPAPALPAPWAARPDLPRLQLGARGQCVDRAAEPVSPAGQRCAGPRVRSLEDVPVVFLHGLGLGLGPNALLLRRLRPWLHARGRSLVVPVFPHLMVGSLASPHMPSAEEVVRAVDALVARECPWAKCYSVVAHSFGTLYVPVMLRCLPASRIHGLVLCEPVCCLLCRPEVAVNFLARPPDPLNAIDVARYVFLTQNPHMQLLLRRHFWWQELLLWYEDIPRRIRRRSVFLLSGRDEIAPSADVLRHMMCVSRCSDDGVGGATAAASAPPAPPASSSQPEEGVLSDSEGSGGEADAPGHMPGQRPGTGRPAITPTPVWGDAQAVLRVHRDEARRGRLLAVMASMEETSFSVDLPRGGVAIWRHAAPHGAALVSKRSFLAVTQAMEALDV